MSSPRRRDKSTPPAPSAPPPHAAAFAAAGVKLICDTCALADLYPGKRRRVLYLQLLHWRKKTNSMATYQTVLAREAKCSLRLVKRTEATGRILAVYAATRWWQDPNRKPVPYDRARRATGHADRWRRRLRGDPLLMRLLTDPTLSGPQRRHLTNRLRLQIIARGIEALAANPGPLLPTLTRTTGRVPPLSATHLPRSTWTAALGLDPLPSNTGDPRVPGYPSGTRAVPSGDELPADRLVANGSSAIESPPAPAGRHGTATPPPARAFGPSDGQDQAALASGEAPATEPPASGGRGEGQPAQTDRPPDEHRTWTLAHLAARAALVHRFESADHAALRHDLHRLHNFMQPGPRPAALPLLILRAIAATLNCTHDDADFLARHYVERLRDERRRAPHGPPPVPRTILTDATGRESVLEWQQSTDPTP